MPRIDASGPKELLMSNRTRRSKKPMGGTGVDEAPASVVTTDEEPMSILRRPSTKEELSSLHPVERILLRAFEFCSSIKLAIVLLAWLSIECIVGTFIESQVNAGAARYFVYAHPRFFVLLALLGFNILCAALIRFPWKRYQTGFVVTHIGLLVILAGSMMTARNYLDTLMIVKQGETESTIVDPSQMRLVVEVRDSSGRTRLDEVAIDPGPFSWGHKLFDLVPWKKDHQESHILPKTGGALKVLKYYANSDAEETYRPGESGVPAVRYRLFHPDRTDIDRWLAVDGESRIGGESLGAGSVLLWQVDSQEELDHFVHAVPKEPAGGELGTLAYSHAGKHYTFDVEKLRERPITVPGTEIRLEIADYMPNAQFNKLRGDWINVGEFPANPLLKIKVTAHGEAAQVIWALGLHPEFSRLLKLKFGAEHQFTYFPAEQASMIQLAMTPEGRMGYRALGRAGVVASEIVEKDKEYPSWAGLTFVPLEIMPNAERDIRLRSKPPKKGKDGTRGVVVELDLDGKTIETSLVMNSQKTTRLGKNAVRLAYDVWQDTVPFKIRLDEFDEPKNPGTNQAAAYRSVVTLFEAGDTSQSKGQKHDIYMNHPLYYRDPGSGQRYTLYQSGIDHTTGTPVSTYTVAFDSGLRVKYAGAVILCVGIALMFYMGNYFKQPKRIPAGKES